MKTYEKLLQYALRIIVRKRYTVAEMQKKLEQFFDKNFEDPNKGLEEDSEEDEVENVDNEETSVQIISRVIERLVELKYLDDKQFIKDYISDRIKFRPRGKFLIQKELNKKGLSRELINSAFSESEIDEVEIAKKILEKYSKKIASLPKEKQKAKTFSILASKGINPETIYKVVQNQYNGIQ